MIETMYSVQIIGLKEDYFKILRFIRYLGVLHLMQESGSVPPEVEFSDLPLKRDHDKLKERETRLTSLISHLIGGEKPEDALIIAAEEHEHLSVKELIVKCDEIIDQLNPELLEIERTQRILDARQEQLAGFTETFQKAQELVERLKQTENTEVLILILDRRGDISLAEFERKVAQITEDQYQLQFRSLDENHNAVLVIFPKDCCTDIETLLYGYRISQLWLPEELQGLPYQELPERAHQIQEQYRTQIRAGEERKNDLKSQFTHQLIQLRNEIRFRITGLKLLMNSFSTDTIFRLEGFVPEKFIKKFEIQLQEAFGAIITIHKEKATTNAPILRTNPPPIKAFETLTNLGALPKYKTLDPTPFIFVLFPLFWGLMVGDIAYGIIILLGAYYLRTRVKTDAVNAIGKIFMVAAVWAIFFGFLFGEFFGDLAIRANLLRPIWFDRLADVLLYLQVSIIIGFIIVSFGLGLGIYNNFQLKHNKDAIADGSILMIWVVIAAGLGSLVFLENSRLLWPSLAVDLVAIGVLIWAQGPLGILSLYSRFSNILSYARLMAIGMISVMMTYVANLIAITINPFAGIPFAVILHLINIIIAVLSPSVHALRLNLYEFFTQFEKPGGIPYRPFGIN
ncbi:MAG: V-type ATP synthase subunit I [Candidatus Heimdallarchaeota archaeon]